MLGEEVWNPARVSEGWVGAVMTRGGGGGCRVVRGGFLVGVEGRRVWVVGRAAVRMGGCRC